MASWVGEEHVPNKCGSEFDKSRDSEKKAPVEKHQHTKRFKTLYRACSAKPAKTRTQKIFFTSVTVTRRKRYQAKFFFEFEEKHSSWKQTHRKVRCYSTASRMINSLQNTCHASDVGTTVTTRPSTCQIKRCCTHSRGPMIG